MTPRVTVVTAIYGGFDTLKIPPDQDIDCDWVCVTDTQPPGDTGPWRIITATRPHVCPRLGAKIPRARPDLYTDTDTTLWIDASVKITSPDFVRWATAPLTDHYVAMIPHPDRTSILDEAHAGAHLPKYAGQRTIEEAHYYLDRGFPDGWGLWATGVMANRCRTPVMQHLGDAWLRAILRWSLHDQISLPPLLREAGIRPADLDSPLRDDPRFDLVPHNQRP
jgi:hypothetical protein